MFVLIRLFLYFLNELGKELGYVLCLFGIYFEFTLVFVGFWRKVVLFLNVNSFNI